MSAWVIFRPQHKQTRGPLYPPRPDIVGSTRYFRKVPKQKCQFHICFRPTAIERRLIEAIILSVEMVSVPPGRRGMVIRQPFMFIAGARDDVLKFSEFASADRKFCQYAAGICAVA